MSLQRDISNDPVSFRDWNEEMSKRYDPDCFYNNINPFIRWVEKQRINWLHRFLAPKETDKILDVGCGAGNSLNGLTNKYLYGVDISLYLLGKARNLLQERVVLVRADAQDLPYPNRSFDRVISSEVIEHVINPSAFLSEIARVLKPEGVAVLTIPNEILIIRLRKILSSLDLFNIFIGDINARKHNKRQIYSCEWHLNYFNSYIIRPMLIRHFSIQKVKAIPSALFPLHWIIKVVLNKNYLSF